MAPQSDRDTKKLLDNIDISDNYGTLKFSFKWVNVVLFSINLLKIIKKKKKSKKERSHKSQNQILACCNEFLIT